MSKSKDEIGPKVRRLAEMPRDLRWGQHFSITRLTVIKSLAKEPKLTNCFVLHLAEKAEQMIQKSRRPQGMSKSAWDKANAIVPEAMTEMSKYVKRRSNSSESKLRDLWWEIKDLQNEYKNIRWGAVRIVDSRELLIVEQALECVLTPYACATLAYQVASDYAERYDPKYPSGLTPASAPCVEDIAEFWCQEHLGKSLDETFEDE